jgi:hypothetical protein
MGLVYHSPGLVLFLTPASAVGKRGLPAVLPGLLQALPSLASLQIGQAPQAQQQQQGERQQRRESAQRQAQAAVAQAESALVASGAQISRLAQ